MSQPHALFLCEQSGNMARPWGEAGYRFLCVDIANTPRTDGNLHFIQADIMGGARMEGGRVRVDVRIIGPAELGKMRPIDFVEAIKQLLRTAAQPGDGE